MHLGVADMHHSADKLEYQIREAVPSLVGLSLTEIVPGHLDVTAVLPVFDWDVRQSILEIVEDIARQFVHEVTITAQVVDAGATLEIASL